MGQPRGTARLGSLAVLNVGVRARRGGNRPRSRERIDLVGARVRAAAGGILDASPGTVAVAAALFCAHHSKRSARSVVGGILAGGAFPRAARANLLSDWRRAGAPRIAEGRRDRAARSTNNRDGVFMAACAVVLAARRWREPRAGDPAAAARPRLPRDSFVPDSCGRVVAIRDRAARAYRRAERGPRARRATAFPDMIKGYAPSRNRRSTKRRQV